MYLNRSSLSRIARTQHEERNISEDNLCCQRHQKHWHADTQTNSTKMPLVGVRASSAQQRSLPHHSRDHDVERIDVEKAVNPSAVPAAHMVRPHNSNCSRPWVHEPHNRNSEFAVNRTRSDSPASSPWNADEVSFGGIRRGRIILDYQGRRHLQIPPPPIGPTSPRGGSDLITQPASRLPPNPILMKKKPPPHTLLFDHAPHSVLYTGFDGRPIMSDGMHLPAPKVYEPMSEMVTAHHMPSYVIWGRNTPTPTGRDKRKTTTNQTPLDIFMLMNQSRKKRFPEKCAEIFESKHAMYT
eukprot:PhF_6_TR29059/c0_g1_i3/m.42332